MGLAQKEKNYNRFTSTRLVWLINADLDVTSKNQWGNSHWDLNNKCMKARNEKPNHTALDSYSEWTKGSQKGRVQGRTAKRQEKTRGN